MKKWLKYILIAMFMVIGVDNVGALSASCFYDVPGFDFSLSYVCVASDDGELSCSSYTDGDFFSTGLTINSSNLKAKDFISNNEATCPNIIYAKLTKETIAGDFWLKYSYLISDLSLVELDKSDAGVVGSITTSYIEFIYNEDRSTIIAGEDEVIGDPEQDKAYINGCEDLGETGKLIRQIYNLLKYLIPVVVIGLSIVDFLKVVLNGEEKVFKEAWTKFIKRIIIGVIILILPAILSLLINLSGVLDNYGIDKNNIFCIFR